MVFSHTSTSRINTQTGGLTRISLLAATVKISTISSVARTAPPASGRGQQATGKHGTQIRPGVAVMRRSLLFGVTRVPVGQVGFAEISALTAGRPLSWMAQVQRPAGVKRGDYKN